MIRKTLLSLLVLALCVAFALPAMAQDVSSFRGNLSGLVYDSSQSLVPGATITITGPTGSQTQSSSGQGSFLFTTLIPGFYSVRVEKPGFKVSQVGNVEVLINKTTSVQVTLEPGAVTQVVEVASASLTVDTSAASVNSDLADTFYENVPVQRNVASLFYLAPGVVSGIATGNSNPAISGSSGLENLYVADGVSINDPAFGGLGVWSRAYSSLGSGINLSFVKEVQVKTGGFEPQYGHASGGIVQIVTKSGGSAFHGALAGYFNTRSMQDTFLNADDPNFHVQNLVGRHIADARYEADGEMGGYVPLFGLKDKLFFFGTFNPTWSQANWSPAAGVGLNDFYPGGVQYRTFSEDYAGKLTFKINNSNTVESSVFGDPNSTNEAPPFTLLNASNTTVNSKWNYGTRNWATRYDGTISPTWTISGAFTWSWNHFNESPAQNLTQIFDQSQIGDNQQGAFVPIGFGFLEPYNSETKGIDLSTSKTFHFAGQHTFMVGYNWQYPIYNDITVETGPRFTLPELNANGTDPGYDTNTSAPGGVVGRTTDAALSLVTAGPGGALGSRGQDCSLCPFLTFNDLSGNPVTERVVLQQTRGRFDGGTTASSGKYHAAYANDSWAIGTHVTLNLGLRWEEQRLQGNVAEHVFNDMWSPRIGIVVDPKGDRKSKIYANFGRYAFVLPLDAAVRELSSELDDFNVFWQPASTNVGCPGGLAPCVITDANGNPDYPNLFVPDSAHLLNKVNLKASDPASCINNLADTFCGGVNRGVTINVSGGEPFQQGTRMEYTDEFVVGAEHQFRGGIVASVRYIDRRMKRVIEDEGGISVEQFNALANNGGSLNYFIGNPNAKSDIFVNPNEVVFQGDVIPSACIDSNGNATPYVALDNQIPTGQPTGPNILRTVGSACFPAVNTNTWTTSSGALLPDCTSLAQSKIPGSCAAFGGEFYADGKPDTYKDPKREYEAVEFEVNKSFSHNWAMVANWRIAQLRGNYEGAFRNDNGQADPGISSLFDLTEGALGLIGQQQGIGSLNTDRRHVINVNTYYILDHGFMKGLVLGPGVTVATGVPLTTLAAQEAYQNQGEVPLFGRGDLGRAPLTGSVNMHLEYPWKINDRFTLKLGFDAFNIADGRRETLVNQFVDQGFGLENSDFGKPQSRFFQPPFSSRGVIRLEF